MFIGSLATVYALMPRQANRQSVVGQDFIAFYTAGSFLRDGRSRQLYDLHAVGDFQHALAHRHGDDLGQAIGPWWNPPYYAWLFVPFARFDYPLALRLWLLGSVACVGVSLLILARWCAKADRGGARFATWGLVPVLVLLSTPFLQAMTHAQNTGLSLMILTLVVMAWRAERALLCGAILGLLAYKPQLVAVVTAVATIVLGWRVIAGLALTGAALLAVNLTTLPGTLGDYQQLMPKNLHFVLCEVPYLWDRHVTFKAFWRLLLQGYPAGDPSTAVTILTSACVIVTATLLLRASWRTRALSRLAPAGERFDRLISATIVTTPLLMPFYFDYDQLLLAIPLTLYAIEKIGNRSREIARPWYARSATWLFCYYPWLMINPDVAGKTHFNLAVVLLAGVAVTFIRRAVESRDTQAGTGAGVNATPAPATARPIEPSPSITEHKPKTARRLFVGGLCMASIVLAMICVNVTEAIKHPSHKLALGHDLLPSYVAGGFVRQGRPRDMYEFSQMRAAESALVLKADLQMDPRYGPWLNPPFFAWVFVPLSALPYRAASAVFLAINLCLLAGSLVLLTRMTAGVEPNRQWLPRVLPALLLCSSMPFWQAICHQQNSFISLMILSGAVTLWLAELPFFAGAVIGLLFFKPQLALAVAVVLAFAGGRRVMLGLAVTATLLLCLTLVSMPHLLSDYFVKLPAILRELQTTAPYNWGRQVTPRSFFRLMFQGHVRGPTALAPRILSLVTISLTAIALTAAIVRLGPNASRASRQKLVAASIICMPLLMPYYMDYDLVLMAVPAALLAREWIARAQTRATFPMRLQLGLWVALFVVTQINPGLAGQTRINLTPVVIAALAVVSVARAWEREESPAIPADAHIDPPRAMAA